MMSRAGVGGSRRRPARSRSRARLALIAAAILAIVAVPAAVAGFNPKVDYPAGNSPIALASGDFDRDGRRDLAVANLSDDDVSILAGKTGGTFKAKVDYPVGNSPYSVASGDFDRDGRRDLAVANLSDDDVSILINDG